MSSRARRYLIAVFIVIVLIQIQIAANVYAARRAGIVFNSTRDGNNEIYVMDVDGGNQVRLTIDPARDYDPSWSPDGDRIAFVSNREKEVEQIYVMDSDGRKLMRLTKEATNQQPAWSPVGEKIAYVRNKGGRQVWVMDADGGNQKQLTQIGKNEQPAWSPDGVRIAFVSYARGANGIYVMDENGNMQERLTPNMAFTANPSWSPDGNWIAYGAIDESHTFQIYVVRVVGEPRLERLTRDLPHKLQPAWSPDGNTIAYSSWVNLFNRKTIHLMTADGKHLKQLSENHHGSDTDPDWFYLKGWSVPPDTSVVTIWGEIKASTANRR